MDQDNVLEHAGLLSFLAEPGNSNDDPSSNSKRKRYDSPPFPSPTFPLPPLSSSGVSNERNSHSLADGPIDSNLGLDPSLQLAAQQAFFARLDEVGGARVAMEEEGDMLDPEGKRMRMDDAGREGVQGLVGDGAGLDDFMGAGMVVGDVTGSGAEGVKKTRVRGTRDNQEVKQSKRAEQNRKAQQNFRKRRDEHIKALESRTAEVDVLKGKLDKAEAGIRDGEMVIDSLRMEVQALRTSLLLASKFPNISLISPSGDLHLDAAISHTAGPPSHTQQEMNDALERFGRRCEGAALVKAREKERERAEKVEREEREVMAAAAAAKEKEAEERVGEGLM